MTSRIDRRWLWAAALLFSILACFEVLWLRPGLGAPEELAGFAYAQAAGETWRWWLRFGGGAWHRGLISLFTAGTGPWQLLYLYNITALGLLAVGLWRWGKALGGETAAAAALILALSAPFTFLQARTTFAYVLLPGLLLGFGLALKRRRHWALEAALGLLAGLACLDYDAWLPGLGALTFIYLGSRRAAQADWRPLLLGLAAGLAVVWALQVPFQGAWNAQRAALPSTLASNLKSYFFGGDARLAMGLEAEATFPWLAWPGLLLAVRIAPWWLWAWAAVGLAPLYLGGPMQEPNRAIVAWPALLLLSGLGWAAWLSTWEARQRRRVLILGLLLAPFLGRWQFDRAIERWDVPIHGLSRRLNQAADFLSDQGDGLGLRLDTRDSLVLRRFAGQSAFDPAKYWVLMPPDLADPKDARWGLWRGFGDPAGKQSWLLRPSAEAWPLLREAAQSPALDLRFESLPDEERLARLRARAKEARSPLTASIEEAQRVQLALRLGQTQQDDLAFSTSGHGLSSAPLQQIAGAFAAGPPGERAEVARRILELPGERWRRLDQR